MVQSSSELSKSEKIIGRAQTAQNGAQVPTVMGPILHDSMVTVRLSEPSLATFSRRSSVEQGNDDGLCLTDGAVPGASSTDAKDGKIVVLRDSIIALADEMDSDKDTIYEGNSGLAVKEIRVSSLGNMDGPIAAANKQRETDNAYFDQKRGVEDDGVNWEVLERTEEQEPRNQDTEDVSHVALREACRWTEANSHSPRRCYLHA